MKCVICNEDIGVQANGWSGGHNAEPVESGRCCTDCNQTKVIPARIDEMIESRRQAREYGETNEQ